MVPERACCLQNCMVDDRVTDAIGLYKSESRDWYLQIGNNNTGYDIECQRGINPEKLDKGCLILNSPDSNYKIYVTDNNIYNGQYWKDQFLVIKEIYEDMKASNIQLMDYLHQMEDQELINICKEIYEWRYITGKLKSESPLKFIMEKFAFYDSRYLESLVMEEAEKRYHKLAVLLIRDNPINYLV